MPTLRSKKSITQKRSRIVVNVDQVPKPAPSSRKSRRGVKVLSFLTLALVLLLVVVVAGGYVWWQSYQKSPAYSLALMINAAQHDDMQTVENQIDSERLAQSLVPQVTDKLMRNKGVSGNETFVRRQIEAATPYLLPTIRESLHAEIMRSIKEFAARSHMPLSLMALAIRTLATIKEEGDTATVRFDLRERNIEVAMQQDSGRWKIVGIKDDELASNLANRIGSTLQQFLPGARQPANEAHKFGQPKSSGK